MAVAFACQTSSQRIELANHARHLVLLRGMMDGLDLRSANPKATWAIHESSRVQGV